MASFTKAIPIILSHEGGYVNNPNDSGGATKFGISLRFLKDHDIGDFDMDGDIDANDVKTMTMEHAMAIYRIFWWDKYKYGLINDQTICTKIFDFSVNMGAKRAHILLQQALNDAFDLNLDCDGILGTATLQTINAVKDGEGEQILIDEYCNKVWGFYQSIASKNPKLKVFLKGWRNRAYGIDTANEIK
ncbi:MAG: glycoside hydrolase family 108 protein [Nitrososphaeraceae archaeon]